MDSELTESLLAAAQQAQIATQQPRQTRWHTLGLLVAALGVAGLCVLTYAAWVWFLWNLSPLTTLLGPAEYSQVLGVTLFSLLSGWPVWLVAHYKR